MMSGEKNVWAASTHVKVGRQPGRPKAFKCLTDVLQKDVSDLLCIVMFIALMCLVWTLNVPGNSDVCYKECWTY